MANKKVILFSAGQSSAVLVLFASFVIGCIISMNAISKGLLVPAANGGTMWHASVIVLPSASALILSSSLFGLLLMPLCSFSFGFLLYWLAYSSIAAGVFEYTFILPYLFICPIFFLISTAGMDNSAVLCTAFFKSTPTLRSLWGKRFAITLMSVAAVTLCAYLVSWA